MAYYNICPDCGSNLDPGEACDCKKQRTEPGERKDFDFGGDMAYGRITTAGRALPRYGDRAVRVG